MASWLHHRHVGVLGWPVVMLVEMLVFMVVEVAEMMASMVVEVIVGGGDVSLGWRWRW